MELVVYDLCHYASCKKGVHTPFLDDAFTKKLTIYCFDQLTYSIAELEAWWDYTFRSIEEKLRIERFFERAKQTKQRTLPYNEQSGLRMTA